MSSKENTFDKIIKSKMEDYEILPDEDFWNNIESAVSRRRGAYRLVKITSVALIVVIASYFLYKRVVSISSSNSTKQNEVNEGSSLMPGFDIHKENGDPQSKNVCEPLSKTSTLSQREETQEYLSKQQVIQRKEQLDSISTNKISIQEQDFKEETFGSSLNNPDSLKAKSTSIENAVPKKVVKKPVYIIRQDTIYKIDTLKVKKRKN